MILTLMHVLTPSLRRGSPLQIIVVPVLASATVNIQ
jgi:hypothetical protein